MNHRRKSAQHPAYSRQARGPNGRPLCRVCLAECPPKRRTFCGDACVIQFKIATGAAAHIRPIVFDRDRGVCALCGRDTVELRARIRRLLRQTDGLTDERRYRLTVRLRRNLGLNWGLSLKALLRAWLLLRSGWSRRYATAFQRSLWDADHIVPLIEGGDATIENLRTLCVPCHVGETAALRRRRKKGASEMEITSTERNAVLSGNGERKETL